MVDLYNRFKQYNQEDIDALIKRRHSFHPDKGGYVLRGGYLQPHANFPFPQSKTLDSAFTHIFQPIYDESVARLGSWAVVEENSTTGNYFPQLVAQYNWVKHQHLEEPIVLVYGSFWRYSDYKAYNIRPYSIMFDGNEFSYNPFYKDDGEVDVRLVIP